MDKDGSRNDIGMFGGHNFFLMERPPINPSFCFTDVSHLRAIGGTVTIESTGATVK